MRLGVIFRGNVQLIDVEDMGFVPLAAAQLEVVVHLDRVERAILRAKAAVHTDVHINEKLGGFRDRFARGLVLPLHDPDALRRADLGADAAGGAALGLGLPFFFLLAVEDQDRQHPEPLRRFKPLLRIGDREDPPRVAGDEMPQRDRQPPQQLQPVDPHLRLPSQFGTQY